MSETVRTGTEVRWSWGNGSATGTVTEVRHDEVTRTIKGNEVTRKGSQDDPALVIEQEDGTTVLKLRSEVERT